MKGIDKRNRIFNTYSRNLKFLIDRYDLKLGIDTGDGPQPLESDVYICPFCLRAFTPLALNQFCSNPLTLEDLPPKSVGGSPKILTCKECNNKSGQDFDRKILDSLVTESFLKMIPNSKIISYIGINDGKKYPAIIQVEQNRTINFNLTTSSNLQTKKDLDYLIRNWEGSKMNFTFTGPNKNKLLSSLQRIGLLLTFYYFGNRVLLEGAYNRIRLSISDPEENVPPHAGLLEIPPNKDIKPGIYIVNMPREMRSYFIVFQIKNETLRKTVGFPFPGPGEIGWKNYLNYGSLNKKTDFSLENITSKEMVHQESYVDAYDILFERIDEYWPSK